MFNNDWLTYRNDSDHSMDGGDVILNNSTNIQQAIKLSRALFARRPRYCLPFYSPMMQLLNPSIIPVQPLSLQIVPFIMVSFHHWAGCQFFFLSWLIVPACTIKVPPLEKMLFVPTKTHYYYHCFSGQKMSIEEEYHWKDHISIFSHC